MNSGYVFSETSTGILSGRVEFHGQSIPEPEKFPVKVNQDQCGKEIESEALIIGQNSKGIKNVIITLESQDHVPVKYPFSPSLAFKIDKCRFSPHIIIIQNGTGINIENKDSILHNIFFLFEDHNAFNTIITPTSNATTKQFDRPGFVQVKCNLHPFMEGYLMVTDTPYFTLTDKEGTFSIPDIPAGKYLLMVRHEMFEPIEKTIEIKPNIKLNLFLGFRESEKVDLYFSLKSLK